MASLRFEDYGNRQGWRLQFRDAEKRNRSIWLGDATEYAASEIKAHVEHLLLSVKKGRPPEMVTAQWLGEIGDQLRNKLAGCGLCEPVSKRIAKSLTLVSYLDEYINERRDVKKATLETYMKAKANLIDYFGKKKLLRSITSTEAKKWRIWLKMEGNGSICVSP